MSDYQHRQQEFLNNVSEWLKQGKLKYKKDIVTDLENAPSAFIGLLQSANFGKLVVKVSDNEKI